MVKARIYRLYVLGSAKKGVGDGDEVFEELESILTPGLFDFLCEHLPDSRSAFALLDYPQDVVEGKVMVEYGDLIFNEIAHAI